MNSSIRLDKYLLINHYFHSRESARSAIMQGQVLINDEPFTKPGRNIKTDNPGKIVIKEQLKYVSRGGLKLEKALKTFAILPHGKKCLDVGSSTGGFTDCLLQHGAKSVTDIDCGTNQLAWKIRSHPAVRVFEKTNARETDRLLKGETFDLVVMDVSFISITKILPSLKGVLHPESHVVVLIKPQFEAERKLLSKKGTLDKSFHEAVLEKLFHFFKVNLWCLEDLTSSPIKGAKGNREYLASVKPVYNPDTLKNSPINQDDLKKIIYDT